MKLIITIMALTFTAASFACANFAGNFTCTVQDDNYTYSLGIEQNGAVFRITDDEGTDEFTADGQRRAIPNDTNLRNAFYTGSCSGNTVTLLMTGDIFDDETGQVFPFKANMIHALPTRNHVVQTTTTELLGQTVVTTTHCRRN